MAITKRKNVYALLGHHLRKARMQKGLSGNELADIINLSQQQISRYERGINKLSLDKLIEIVVFLDIDVGDIVKVILTAVEHEKRIAYSVIK
ncbi:helix-turn-helix domain-containing protein [Providencia manganoxydans]|uniref:helix-turn-helix domain-containing protein n=1 Tax=Providencia manganoxydans TaxID=2923283 RepID=UPI0032DA5330